MVKKQLDNKYDHFNLFLDIYITMMADLKMKNRLIQ